MKVLFVADVPLENPTSGSEQVLNQQATGLLKRGMEVYAITRRAGTPSMLIKNVDGVREGSYSASPRKTIPFLFSLVKYPSKFYNSFSQNNPFKVAICHQPFTCFSLLAARKLGKIPIIYVFHSPSHEEFLLSDKNGNRLENFLHVIPRRIIERFCLRKSRRITTLSRYMKQKVVELHRIPPPRIDFNPGGVDLQRFRPHPNHRRLKKELGFPKGKIHLLTIRNLEPRMGIDNLLQSIYILKKKDIEVHLTVGGEGAERQNLENLIDQYNLINDVTMTGFIPTGYLSQYYNAADFFILPTRNLEGFGLVTTESMACGTPVLGTPVGGTKEILSGFNSKFLFKDTSPESMADGIQFAIEKYFNEKGPYEELRLHCREYAKKNYSWDRHIDQLKSILEEIP